MKKEKPKIKPKGKENFKKAIVKSVLGNSLTATAWIFTTIFEVGEMTLEIFLSKPSLYADVLPGGYTQEYKKPKKKKPNFKEITIRQSIRRLEKQGFVKRNNGKIILTAKGLDLANYILKRKKVKSQKWDGKYRVVIFDIPESKERVRHWLREELYLLEYKKLQESVFISKYALPDDLIKEIKKLKISNCVNYLLVDKVYKNII